MNLTQRLLKAMAWSADRADKSIKTELVAYHSDDEAIAFILGARWQHAQLLPFLEAMAECVEACEYIDGCRDKKCQQERCTCTYDTARTALSKLEAVLAKAEGESK